MHGGHPGGQPQGEGVVVETDVVVVSQGSPGFWDVVVVGTEVVVVGA